MTLVLGRSQVRAIEDHARETFPEECCGFLLGVPGEPRRVALSRRAVNVVESDRARRYVIDPRAFLAVEKELRGTGQEILGFYHSHPDHPAEPSEFDRSHAWPWYAYVILSIVDRKPASMRAWSLDGDTATFRPEALSVV